MLGGVVGATIIAVIYTFFINKYSWVDISYIYVIFITIILSTLSQIGDLSASTLKRTTKIKDFGNLIPGHGGMFDRIDSVIFIAPFAYFLLTMI